MDSEQVIIPAATADMVNAVKEQKKSLFCRNYSYEGWVKCKYLQTIETLRGMDEQVHFPSIWVQDRRLHDHELPHTTINVIDDGGGFWVIWILMELIKRHQREVPFLRVRWRNVDVVRFITRF